MARLIRLVDRPFAVSALVFGLGALVGFLLSALLPVLRAAVATLLLVRVLEPVREAELIGNVAVVSLVFANNALPVLLSFVYPILLARIRWAPPLTKRQNGLLLTGYSVLAAFLLGFLDLGATLGSVLFTRGISIVIYLLSHSLLHAPIEFTLVLISVSEPARVALRQNDSPPFSFNSRDATLLLACLLGLLASAIIEFALAL